MSKKSDFKEYNLKKALLIITTSAIIIFADNAINNYGTMNVGGNVNQTENNQNYVIEKMSIASEIDKFASSHVEKMKNDTNYVTSIEAASNTEAIATARKINNENISKSLKKQQCTKGSFGFTALKIDLKLAIARCESFFE